MNLKGQYAKLDRRQRWRLKKFAINKQWKAYWYFKKIYLTATVTV